METRKVEIASWKNSSLAVMAYGIDDGTRKNMRNVCVTKELKKAGQTVVHMREELDGSELAMLSALEPNRQCSTHI